jgi:acyl-coenzyme A synthetase/AMP-(fatty) acid ligase
MIDAFGSSETGSAMSLDAADLGGEWVRPSEEPGRFFLDADSAVLDEDLRHVRPGSGVVGRVARRGHFALGYYYDQEQTERVIVRDPDGTRWFLQSDLATIDADGLMRFVGRQGRSVTRNGEVVHLDEIETALLGHPLVRDAVVIAQTQPAGALEAVALIVSSSSALSKSQLSKRVSDDLDPRLMPGRLLIMDLIRRTPSGKTDYQWAASIASTVHESVG